MSFVKSWLILIIILFLPTLYYYYCPCSSGPKLRDRVQCMLTSAAPHQYVLLPSATLDTIDVYATGPTVVDVFIQDPATADRFVSILHEPLQITTKQIHQIYDMREYIRVRYVNGPMLVHMTQSQSDTSCVVQLHTLDQIK